MILASHHALNLSPDLTPTTKGIQIRMKITRKSPPH
jgi:hypothetical protein